MHHKLKDWILKFKTNKVEPSKLEISYNKKLKVKETAKAPKVTI